MIVWGIVFMPLLIARPLLIVGLAMADAGSADLPRVGLSLQQARRSWFQPSTPGTRWAVTLASTARWVATTSASGTETCPWSARARSPGHPTRCTRWFSLGLWGIALFAGSLAALAAALFQHAYIWVHYYCTEAPDMALIYGGTGNSGSDENLT